MASATDGLQFVKDKLCGNWKLDRSENFDEFLREMGVNFLIRKMAASSKPEQEISVEGETIKISTKSAVWTRVQAFKLNEEFEQEQDGVKQKIIVTVEGEKMMQRNTPLNNTDTVKPQTIYRELVNDEMVMKIHVGDVVCTRVFKKMS